MRGLMNRGLMNSLGVLNNHNSSVSAQPTGRSRRWIPLASLIILGFVGFTGWQAWQARIARLEAARAEAVRPPEITTVSALGRLEPQGELIHLTTSTQGSRVEELLVKAGDRVQANQVIAILDNRDRLQAALHKAEHQVEVARTQKAQVEAGAQSGEIQAQLAEISRLEADQIGSIETQKATIARLAAEVENARADFQRYDRLHQQGGISASERDARQLALTTAAQQLTEAKAILSRIQATTQEQISQARATLDRIEEVRPVNVNAANAEVRSAIASVAEAQAHLAQAYVRSPSHGQIIKIHTQPGETIANEGIATLGETAHMMVVAEVYQDDIVNVHPGQSVAVTTPVIGKTLQGSVERIGLQVKRQEVVNENPAINIDAKVVEVHIRLTPEASEKVSGLSDMQVTATIQTKSGDTE